MKRLLFLTLFFLASFFVFGKNAQNPDAKKTFNEVSELSSYAPALNGYIIDIQQDYRECTVTITASIDVLGFKGEVSVAATASTCAQAAKDAAAGVGAAFEAPKKAMK